FKGIEGSMTLLHGGQGCATYIRRYMIGHFREPIDIGSSSFTEDTAIFGGKKNLFTSLDTLIKRYHPALIGIATTCVSETIGEDLHMYLHEYRVLHKAREIPILVDVSTPSYEAYHGEGYWRAVTAVIQSIGEKTDFTENLTIIPGMVSPGDLRKIKSWMRLLNIPAKVFPDYSDTLDGGPWEQYQPIPKGGTPVDDIRSIPNSSLCIEFAAGTKKNASPADYIEQTWRIPSVRLPLPIGIRLTDHFFSVMERFFSTPLHEELRQERQRLVDLYVDGHKLAYGKRFALYGDEDFAASMTAFLCEAGFIPALIAVNSSGGEVRNSLLAVCDQRCLENTVILENPDFGDIEEEVRILAAAEAVDFMIGNSKGFKIALHNGLPLVRTGFPIHDRIGASRMVTLGYEGAAHIYTTIINMLLEKEQNTGSRQYGTY
ncbi:MAG: nitrogenase, partial [Spirochaetales bacterium]|nr:nitrogenase [Spirochaetales bacterium]